MPAQTYEHAIHSAQVAVLKLAAQHKYHANLPMHLEETGSNKVEKSFSEMRGFGKVANNQQDCNAKEARERLEKLITIFKYEAEDDGISLGSESRATQRDLKIHLHEDQSEEDADPALLCDGATLIEKWKEGDEEAKKEAERLGMKPSASAAWWETPWLEEENDIQEMGDDGAAGGGGGGGGGGSSDDEDSDDEDSGGGDRIEDEEGDELAQLLTSVVAASPQRTKTNPLVAVPEGLGGGMSSKPLSSTNLTIRAQRLAMIALRGSRLALQLSLTSKRRRRHGQHCKAAEVEAQAGQGRKQQQQEEQQAHQWKQHQQQRLLLNPLVRRLLLLLLNLLVLQEGEGGKK